MPVPKDPIKYQEFIKRISGKNNHNYGNSRSEEIKEKISKGCKRNGIGKWNKGKHCSPETEFKKGMIVSEETRKKISKSRKGHIVSEETRKKIGNANRKGKFKKCKKCRKEMWVANYLLDRKKFCSEKCANLFRKGKRLSNRRGKNSTNWKGGTTSENKKIRNSLEFKLWREEVFKRDNWICQKTGIRGIKLHPHHIKNFAQYPKLRFVIDNGITLSEKAHKEFHKIYGRENNDKKQLKEFINKY